MFGFSLAELIVIILVILMFIKPQDLPEIAHFVGKSFFKIKRFYEELKNSFKDLENEFGLKDLKSEMQRGIAEEKAKLEEDFTIIVDMEGNEHKVPNIAHVRPDLDEEKLQEEIKKHNEGNLAQKKEPKKTNPQEEPENEENFPKP
jgi:Sec-independent protein translocase protein TatA